MQEELQKPLNHDQLAQTSTETIGEVFDTLYGDTTRFLDSTIRQDVSELAADAMSRTMEGPLHIVEHRLSEADQPTQENVVKQEERKARGFKDLTHALSAAVRGEHRHRATVTLGVAETLETVSRRESVERDRMRDPGMGPVHQPDYENVPVKDAGLAANMVYEALGISRPVIDSRHQRVGEDKDGRKVGPVSTSGLVSTGELSQHATLDRDPQTGAVRSVETKTPFGVTIIESWDIARADDLSSIGNRKAHEPLKARNPNGGHTEVNSTLHTVTFEYDEASQDKKVLDEIAHEGILTPETTALRGQADSIAERASQRAEQLSEEHNRLVDKSGSKLPFRRPKEQELYEIQETSGSAIFAARVAGTLQELVANSPERTTDGFQARFVRAEYDSSRGDRPTTEHFLEVRPSEKGMSFVISHQDLSIKGEYFLSDEGGLYTLYTNSNGEQSQYEMRGDLEEGVADMKEREERGDAGFLDIPGPSNRLKKSLEEFKEVFDRPYRDPESFKRYPEAEMIAT